MPKKDNFWTNKNVKTLTTMWSKGKTSADIAEKLGDVTRNAVIGKANRLGLEKRPSPIKKTNTKKKPVTKTNKQKVKAMAEEKNILVQEEIRGSFSILDIKECMCRWPIGDPKEKGFHFCGKRVADENCSYCEDHADEAYQVPTKRK